MNTFAFQAGEGNDGDGWRCLVFSLLRAGGDGPLGLAAHLFHGVLRAELSASGHDTSLFPRLVLGSINTDFCN